MLTYLRYALATICFTLSVACLALWWRSETYLEYVRLKNPTHYAAVVCRTAYGHCEISYYGPVMGLAFGVEVKHRRTELGNFRPSGSPGPLWGGAKSFVGARRLVFFPLWYPALVSGLAGIGVLRLGRFTILSATIATTVVAGLFGMAVAL
jgi:hypothetical protein